MEILDALVRAEGHAHHLAASIPEVTCVCLGGSLTQADSILDARSDIDMFTYIAGTELPTCEQLAQQLRVHVSEFRKRSFLIEYRLQLGSHDTNVKFFTSEFIESYVLAPPSLDPQYLEELEAYDRFSILFDRGPIGHLIKSVGARRKRDVGPLALMAVERYGKSLGWAVFQGLGRGYSAVALHGLSQALDMLLCAFYLGSGFYPPSVKWRASDQTLRTLRGGDAVASQLNALTRTWQTGDIEALLVQFMALEAIIAGDFDKSPWIEHAERWWWLGYESIGRPDPGTST